MCLAIPGKIVALEGGVADVDFGGVVRKVNVTMVEPELGEYVVVHAGFAISKMDEEEAQETLRLWEDVLAHEEVTFG